MQVFFNYQLSFFYKLWLVKFFYFYFDPCSFKFLRFDIKFYFIHILVSEFERESQESSEWERKRSASQILWTKKIQNYY
jgi:hypothetical protein